VCSAGHHEIYLYNFPSKVERLLEIVIGCGNLWTRGKVRRAPQYMRKKSQNKLTDVRKWNEKSFSNIRSLPFLKLYISASLGAL